VNLGKERKVITVKDNKDAEAQPVHVASRNGNASQRWRIVYELKGSDAIRKKGQ
jgi:hypothetical protein